MKRGLFIKILFLFIVFLFLINITNANYFIDVRIPLEYLAINPGDSISANVKIVKISEDSEREDYSIKARIVDEGGNKLIEKDKVIAIEEEVETIVSFDIPENMEPGEYWIEVIVGDNISNAGFIVEEAGTKLGRYLIYITITILLLFVVAFYYYNRKLNKLLKHVHKVRVKDLIKKR